MYVLSDVQQESAAWARTGGRQGSGQEKQRENHLWALGLRISRTASAEVKAFRNDLIKSPWRKSVPQESGKLFGLVGYGGGSFGSAQGKIMGLSIRSDMGAVSWRFQNLLE